MTRSNIVLGVPVLLIVLAVCVMAVVCTGCGENQEADRESTQTAVKHTDENEPLNEATLDSLRAMKARFNITRDEYWDETGGVLANDFFELWYPAGKFTVTHGMYAFGKLREAKAAFRKMFGRDPADRLKVICTSTMESYTERTGNEWWVLAKTDADQITFQPIGILHSRSLLDIGVIRAYYEWAVITLSGGRAPQWLVHGMASLQSDEDWVLENQLTEFPDAEVKMELPGIDSALKKQTDRKEYRIANYNAYRMVRRLAAERGLDKIALVIKTMGEGGSPEEAFEEVYGEPYLNVVAYALEFKVAQ